MFSDTCRSPVKARPILNLVPTTHKLDPFFSDKINTRSLRELGGAVGGVLIPLQRHSHDNEYISLTD